MTIAVLVVLAGVLVGVGIDVVLTRRQRARRVELAPAGDAFPPNLPPAAPTSRTRDEGVVILGPVGHEPPEVPSVPWDLDADPFHDDPFGPASDDRS